MGYPSLGVESCYRNPMSEAKRFFEELHGLERVKVYNLCCEREYPSSHFDGRVEIYPFPDHNAPPFEMIRPMCLSVEKWLDEHPKNIVAIHCKAGKGRTGVMVCALLLHGGLFHSAVDAMNYYARARTVDNKGLTIPSQIRYVEYYEHLLQNGRMLCPQLRINNVRFQGLLPSSISLVVVVRNNRRNHETPPVTRATAFDTHLSVPLGVAVAGDVKFEVFRVNLFGQLKPFCHFWVHTSFLEYGNVGASGNDTSIKKVGLDRMDKDRMNRITSGDFSVSINADLVSSAPDFSLPMSPLTLSLLV
jgi:phosphatidylinositol-3,4,5-trisphosphate 3-phosphatase/dual-specificity protein phosphatase PTEN